MATFRENMNVPFQSGVTDEPRSRVIAPSLLCGEN